MSGLTELVTELAKERQALQELQADGEGLAQQVAATPLGQLLEQNRELVRVSRELVNRLEADVKAAALAAFQQDLGRHPHPAVTVKIYQVLQYEEGKAIAYAREHLPEVLTLDRTAFEKIAKVVRFDFVERQNEPRATIATDLGAYVAVEGQEWRALLPENRCPACGQLDDNHLIHCPKGGTDAVPSG